jgi:hypothetical protein
MELPRPIHPFPARMAPLSRPILPSRRYLPPPAQAGMNDLEHRMRREVVLTYVRR